MHALLRTVTARGLLRPSTAAIQSAQPRTGRTMASAAAAASPAKFWLLEYKYVPDILEKRGPYRTEHLAAAQAKADAGKIVLAGAFGEKPEGALFVFKGVEKDEIEAFVAADPYIKASLVTAWAVKPYTVVVQG